MTETEEWLPIVGAEGRYEARQRTRRRELADKAVT